MARRLRRQFKAGQLLRSFTRRVIGKVRREAGKALDPITRRFRAPLAADSARRLHLGCGDVPIAGFCNVDAKANPAVDVVSDILRLEAFAARSADLIYACHVLEHFSHDDAAKALARWFEVLAPGGELRVSVPDLDRIVDIYSRNLKHFNTPGNSPWIGLIYGGQKDMYDFHKTGFNFCWMKHLLGGVGFTDIREYPHAPHFAGVQDGSLANGPFSEYISLNVVARKPG